MCRYQFAHSLYKLSAPSFRYIVLLYLIPRHLSFLWQAFMTCCINMAMPIYFYWWQVSYKVIKGREQLWNLFHQLHTAYYHTISCHWLSMPSGADTQTHTHTYRRGSQINFKKPDMSGLWRTWFKNSRIRSEHTRDQILDFELARQEYCHLTYTAHTDFGILLSI